MDRHLFLFGGGPPFTIKLSKEFALLAGRGNAPIVLLVEEREGWEAYQTVYTEMLKGQGLENFSFIPLQNSPDAETLKEIAVCSGIVIGGGNTEKYQQMIVETELGEAIVNRYNEGIPVAGFSAGALITPESCVISPKDNQTGEQLYRKGLGILKDKVISAHFTTWEEEFSLKIALKKTGAKYGYGIDENTGIYFVNEQMETKDGDGDIHLYRHK